jgi:tRNA pseudouridine55 synthase
MARRRKSGREVHGILLLDKRLGVSSNRALQEVRRLYNANKAGHTGSLDPLATGLLPICFGEATKVSAFLLGQDKRYQVVVQLGVVTDTGDAEGTVLATSEVPKLNKNKLAEYLQEFAGEIEQIPPMYSALKHQGRKLYELARLGQTVERKARRITIYSIHCLAYRNELLTLDVSCSKGTYIRTLAEDIGRKIGCGAMVKALRRFEIESFSLAQAYTFEQLQGIENEADLMKCLLPVDEPLSILPAICLKENQAIQIANGNQISVDDDPIQQGAVRMYIEQKFLGIGEVSDDARLIPKRIFNLI